MTWTTPRTWVNGESETQSILQAHLSDNMAALKTWADGIDTVNAATASSARTRDAVYQNTTAKPMVIMVRMDGQVTTSPLAISVYIGANSSPATLIAHSMLDPNTYTASTPVTFNATAIIPSNYYYKASGGTGGTVTAQRWYEDTLY